MDDLIIGASGLSISPIYLLTLVTAFLLVFIFPLTKDFTSKKEKSQYFYLQAITFVGAIFGAKLAVLMGDALWPIEPFDHWLELIWTGRSIVGALLFGFVFSELAKPMMGYTRLPNDRFAVIIPFSVAIGRIGCWFSGCCLGLESDSALAVTHPDGINRYPIALIEIGFHVTVGGVLLYAFLQRRLVGQIFAVYMILYGLFRFFSENLRATEKAFMGFSAYQWFALLLVLAGLVSYGIRYRVKNRELGYARTG
jgi:phosphatidylglycerol:prolipoprotein diacylglycerol transferase